MSLGFEAVGVHPAKVSRGSFKVYNSNVVALNNAIEKDKYLREILKINGTVLCGGFIRDVLTGNKPKDADIFFTNEMAIKEAHELLGIEREIYVSNFNNGGAFDDSTNTPIQLVHKKTFPSVEAMLDEFDFSVVQLGFDGVDFYVGKNTLNDIILKRISVNLITKPLDSLNRLVNYIKEWDISEPYRYILTLMLEKEPKIVLGTTYYGEE